MNSARARIDAFHRRHGGLCFSDGVFFFYADGARRDINPNGLLAEPFDTSTPENERQRFADIVTFHRLKLQDLVTKFENLDFRLSTTLPSDQDDSLAELEELRDRAEAAQKELDAAEARLNSTAIERRRAEAALARQEERERYDDFQKKRKAIRI